MVSFSGFRSGFEGVLASVSVVVALSSFLFGSPQETMDDKVAAQVEAASLEFSAQQLSMTRYLAIVTGELDSSEEGAEHFGDFRYVFAFAEGQDSLDDKVRVELAMTNHFSNGETHTEEARQLTVKNHIWIERGGSARDVYNDKPEERPSSVVTWDPFTACINYWASLRVRSSSSYRDVAVLMMPPGKLFEAKIDGFDRRVGRWFHGKSKVGGYTEVVLDPKFGNMPTQMELRTLKRGFQTLDTDDLLKCTELYQKNETTWIKHPTGIFLPSEVKCLKVRNDQCGWRLKIEWWVGDEVPQDIFTIEDLLKAHLKLSIVDELGTARVEQRALAERKRTQTNSNQ